jgi:cytochrome c-type biogenesis protein CcmE
LVVVQAGRAREAQDVDAPPEPATRAAEPLPKKKGLNNVGLLIALLVMGGGVLTLVMTSFNKAAVYSKTVDQLVAEKSKIGTRSVRVAGNLVKGSLKRRDQPCEYRFTMSRGGQELKVRYAECIIPDTFRDVPDMDVQVTAEGQLTEEGYLEATHIMAKCPSKYEMRQKKAAGESAPHDMLQPADVPAIEGEPGR